MFPYSYSVSSLKCYVGTSSTKVCTDCSTGMDKCLMMEVDGIVAYTCFRSGLMSELGLTGDGCKSITSAQYCVYSTSNCQMTESTSIDGNSGIFHIYYYFIGRYVLIYNMIKIIAYT